MKVSQPTTLSFQHNLPEPHKPLASAPLLILSPRSFLEACAPAPQCFPNEASWGKAQFKGVCSCSLHYLKFIIILCLEASFIIHFFKPQRVLMGKVEISWMSLSSQQLSVNLCFEKIKNNKLSSKHPLMLHPRSVTKERG